MLDVSELCVRAGRRDLLRGVDLRAEAGQITAIIGPSGAGKSTLLRAISGDIGYVGRITLNGRDIAQSTAPALAQIRAVLPQASVLAFPFTVIEVVRLGLQAPHPTLPQQMLARVGLAGFEGRFYQALSGGEQQRVQLARVLSQVWLPAAGSAPRWLFLDEPVSSLDIAHQLDVMQIAREFADAGGGVVMVMHDLNLSAMFADRIALIGAGRILAHDTPEIVLRDEILAPVYACPLRVNRAPARGRFILPQSVRSHAGNTAGYPAGNAAHADEGAL